jgi:glycosyltransferase involved in cell wall biosynthesis
MDGTQAIPETISAAEDLPSHRVRVAVYAPGDLETVYGEASYIASIVKRLDRHLADPVLVSPVEGPFLEELAALGTETQVVAAPRLLRRGGSGPFARALAAVGGVIHAVALAKHLAREKIDIVQCHDLRAMLTAGVAGKLARRRVVWYVKGELANSVLDRVCFALADLILFQGEANLARRYPKLVKRWRHKIEILSSGIDLAEIAKAKRRGRKALRDALRLDPNKTNIVFVGQVMEAKGLDELVVAMAQVQKAHPDTALTIVGDHGAEAHRAYRKHLELKVKVLCVANVSFTGLRTDVPDIVTLMDVFVMPSHSEGMPRAVIEAMALGKPVVATDVGSVPDLVRDDETGLLVPPRDAEALADALMRLVGDQALGERARALALAECDIGKNVKGLERYYQRLAGTAALAKRG